MTSPTRYPLAWPAHRPRTPWHKQKSGKFTRDGKPVSMATAVDRVDVELTRLGASYPLLSTNVELRLDGQPRSGRSAPSDPGVCLYFSLKGEPFALACDTYSKVEQNVAALAAHLEATRAIERHGVATAAESLQAFTALPPPRTGAILSQGWREVLALDPGFDGLSHPQKLERIQQRYRQMAATRHPDRGGSAAAMAELNAARDAALKELNL